MSERITNEKWYVGAMNDALFIINEPPRPSPVDYHNPELRTKVIAKVSEPHQEGWTREEYEAHANLLAAAPELREFVWKYLDSESTTSDLDREAKRLLAKLEVK